MAIVLFIALVSGIVSLFSSLLAERLLTERIPLLGSFAGLQLSHNTGVAFGIRFPPVLQELLIAVALLAVLWLAIRSTRQLQNPYALRPTPYALGLILGGGIANIIDRLRDGLVTDFFQVGTFPIFNVADSCITIGVLMLLLEMLVLRRRKL